VTRVYCGHEYTVANAAFAQSVEPENGALARRVHDAKALRARGEPTVPAVLGDELATNPFLRARDVATFAARRAAKDHFRS
jgi:hydroxyacylglutathione hydrolase